MTRDRIRNRSWERHVAYVSVCLCCRNYPCYCTQEHIASCTGAPQTGYRRYDRKDPQERLGANTRDK